MLGKAGQEERVKDATGPGHDHLPGLLLGKCGLIDPGMYQGIKGVRQPHHLDPGRNTVPSPWSLLPFTSFWITKVWVGENSFLGDRESFRPRRFM